jgi:hypothetical protein
MDMNSAMINGFSDELQQIHKVANFGEQPLRKGLNFASARPTAFAQ